MSVRRWGRFSSAAWQRPSCARRPVTF
jgi:hypothetical protein